MREALEREAFKHLLLTAKLLYQNAVGCAVNHYAVDFETQGLPGWLADSWAHIEAAEAALASHAALAAEPAASEREATIYVVADDARTAHLRDIDANDQIGALSAAVDAALAYARSLSAPAGEGWNDEARIERLQVAIEGELDGLVCDRTRARNILHHVETGEGPIENAAPTPPVVQEGDDPDEAYDMGKRDGYEEAAQEIDRLTGGDGEYRFCTNLDPERHCPDPATMIQRIVDRFNALEEVEKAHLRLIMAPLSPTPDNTAREEAVSAGVAGLDALMERIEWSDTGIGKYPRPSLDKVGIAWVLSELRGIRSALVTEPAPEAPLTADFTKVLPGGMLDDATYETVQDALDKADAPCQGTGGKWLTLPERIAALATGSAPEAPVSEEAVAWKESDGPAEMAPWVEATAVCTHDARTAAGLRHVAAILRRPSAEAAARWVQKRLDDYVSEHGSYDPSTGMTEFPGTGEEYVGDLEEIIEGIRALPLPAKGEA
ncbi:hypothetical protein ABLE91_05530 [Aquabacter sp. CN5-332]|uniref:hypothetical protein n=1 Tax=Aquabacter sp. CN5-332 TaxID=3156608 RepID=UPI0032B56025